jgi:hypothetical protein
MSWELERTGTLVFPAREQGIGLAMLVPGRAPSDPGHLAASAGEDDFDDFDEDDFDDDFDDDFEEESDEDLDEEFSDFDKEKPEEVEKEGGKEDDDADDLDVEPLEGDDLDE